MSSNDQLSQWDQDHFFHASTHLAQFTRGEIESRIITGGQGVYIKDRNDTELLDAFAGLYCVNVGYGRTEIADAIAEQARELSYYHSYVGHGTEASITLAKMIIDRAPDNMSRVYFGLSGSDANETNIKLVWYYNNVLGRQQKKKIISRWRGYHGSGLMTGSLTGLKLFHEQFDLPLTPVLHTEAPYFYQRADAQMSESEFSQHCADKLEAMILKEGADTIAAFIGEPVLGTGGLIPPPQGYWPAIQAEQGTDKFGPLGHGWTYSAHPVCAAAGVANLALIDSMNLVSNAKVQGQYLNKAMQDTLRSHKNVGDIRGEGMLCAVELVADKDDRTAFDPSLKIAPSIVAAMLRRGVIARAMPQGDIIGFAPPLCLSKSEADAIVTATAASIAEVLD